MKINIVAVGKIKESYYRDAIAEYQKRLGRYIDISIVETAELPPKTQNEADIRQSVAEEGKCLLAAAKGAIIVLAIEGDLVTSPQLASYIDQKKTYGVSEISFIIGGSNGVSQDVLNSADKAISFGRVTYPHQLMRVILAEQIYRAISIISKLPYHK
jgi:23S rRNA (pseudouridine1915-N3)-methyltransferase